MDAFQGLPAGKKVKRFKDPVPAVSAIEIGYLIAHAWGVEGVVESSFVGLPEIIVERLELPKPRHGFVSHVVEAKPVVGAGGSENHGDHAAVKDQCRPHSPVLMLALFPMIGRPAIGRPAAEARPT